MKVSSIDAIRLPEELLAIGREARSLGVELRVVGGLVRDRLLGRPMDNDIDLYTDSPRGGALAERIVAMWNGKLERFPRFGTHRLTGVGRELNIDLARARREVYAAPAALPSVRWTGIDADLVRRDFTCNAIAASCMPEDAGAVVDPHDGRGDLDKGLLRILHPGSFRDDPTRIYRAARFAARFGLELEAKTKRALDAAVQKGFPGKLSRQRLRGELMLVLAEAQAREALALLESWDAVRFLHPGLAWHPGAAKVSDPRIRLGVLALAMGDNGRGFVRSLALPRETTKEYMAAFDAIESERAPRQELPHLGHACLRAFKPRLAPAALQPALLTGADLRDAGVEPGKDFRDILERAARAQWKGEFDSRSGALAWLKQTLR